MNKKLMVMVTTMAFLIAMLPAFASAADYDCDSCSSCSSYINNASAGDTVTLTQNISDTNDACINVANVYDVDFDCGGHELLALSMSSSEIFIVADNWTYSTMSNCYVNGVILTTFISLNDVQNSIFEDWTINVSGAIANKMFKLTGLGSNTTIKDMTIYYDSSVSGQRVLSIENPANTTIDNVSIYGTGNGWGVWVYNTENIAGYEAIMINSIVQNLEVGVYSYVGGGETCLFYNNIFNSTDNYFEDNAQVNDFNTTKTLGTNIVGGPYIGGNWWEGFSNTCNDTDVDGICDDPYTDSGDTDYLPLAVFTPTPPTPPVVEQFPLLGLVPLIVAIAVLIGFVGAFISGLLDLKTALTWIVMAGVAIVIIGVIYTI